MTSSGRCQRRKDMAASGAQQRPDSAEPTLSPVDSPAELPGISNNSAVYEIDYFSQARKALSERSPYEEEASTSGVVTLPSGLSSLLNRHGDNRRRHKKVRSGGEKKKKKSSRGSEKARAFNIWDETEEYFRDLSLSDIDTLVDVSSLSRLASGECFSIPVLGNSPRLNIVVNSSEEEKKDAMKVDLVSGEDDKKVDEDLGSEECIVGVESIDNVAAENGLPQDDGKNVSCVSLEWLLGCRSKVSLTSERPKKKRKLLNGDADLQKVQMTSPSDGDGPFCHYCGTGDASRDLNRLIVCASCKVAVHQKCYGVQDGLDESWLCSWCKLKRGVEGSVNPCVLCPNKGGALKPVDGTVEGVESVKFVHLFCCLWMPEVYVDDLKKMEPVMNVGSIKETRRKLVCNICKQKWGACVRCSHGTCRTSFHPLCAREARHRMEVCAKYGDDNIELRAFCLKHSDSQDNRGILPLGDSLAIGNTFLEANGLPVNSEHKLKIGCGSPNKLNHNGLQDVGLSDCRLIASDLSGCGAVQQHNVGMVGKTNENGVASDSLSFALVLKKLIDRGKVDAKDVAMEIGIAPDALTANINEAYMDPDVVEKIVNWLKAHVYTAAFHKGLKVKFKPPVPSKDESEAAERSVALPISDSGLLDPVAVKSVPPRRRTVSNIRISKDNKAICSSEGVTPDLFRADQLDHENPGSSNEGSPNATVVDITKSGDMLPKVQGNEDKPHKSNLSECVSEEMSKLYLQNGSMFCDGFCPLYSAAKLPDCGSIKVEASSSYIHPSIKKLLQIHNGVNLEDISGPCEKSISTWVKSAGSSCYSSTDNQQLMCTGISKPGQGNTEQLHGSGKMELLEFSPEDEVEGELIFLQHRLLQNAVARKKFTDNLISNVAKSLPQEIDAAHQQRWDSVIVNRYLRDLREAKKLGRKERKHKEAQAVLAAATAAAAASSRVSSFRKDSIDESMQQENLLKLDALNGRNGACSQPMPRAKETLSRVAVTRTSSEKYSDFSLPTSEYSKEQSKSCDICRRSETLFNPILVCSGCKVAVHLDCYRSVKETTGPWYCELCEDVTSRSSAASAINFWEKPYFVAECALCSGTTGAFRKSSDGQWIHAFCAEWVFESTFRRGQINPVEGMESVLKGVDKCCICHCKHGVCMKCCYGHCQTSFHPSCARSAGYYMIVRTTSGKPQHKAYCEKHSLEQKAKSEKHGIEEFKSMKQVRVELERLRLLCERIVKREKLKRELVLCSHDILAFKRDHVARSVLVHSPFILPDGSSESATTSLRGNTEGYRSCSDAIQRSDDITVDSSVSDKHRLRAAVSMDTDPKLDDDCSTSQSCYNHKIPERVQFSGKQIPKRAYIASRNISDESSGLRSKSRKQADTFGKEIVMTSDEASMKNLRLPKGYAYVPADCLSNDKQFNENV
ncbi:hypothetical protein PIB30_008948 [Stylosanthes scabra]|uniref:PHD finger family protein n=1 Tax=Stylosanthes scabra TaxID=79078 RepID=A0ABU6S5P7_9FABA|nr:hypothetical protein [Stylosanthes scabra]